MARILYRHPILTLEGTTVPTSAGPTEFLRLRIPDWVNCAPITEAGELVLVEQHRHGIDAPTLEVPGGIVDPGESPEQAALRELREETGFGEGRVEPLGWVWSNPAIQDNKTWLFAVHGVRYLGPPQLSETEQITVHRLPIETLPALLRQGRVRHALAVITLQRLLLRRGPEASGGAAGPHGTDPQGVVEG